MLNISPIGRSCTPEERIEFSELDKVQGLHLGPASPWLVWHHLRSQVLHAPPFQGEGRFSFKLCIYNKGDWEQETQGKTHDGSNLILLGTTNARGWPAGFPVLWESPREQGSYLTACFLIYSTQRWPSSCILSPTSPAQLMGFPNWEGHGRSAGLISLEDLAHAHASFCLGRLSWG